MKYDIYTLFTFLVLSSGLFLGVDCKDEPPVKPDPIEPDSTSHEILWKCDTIGTWQSAAIDVWGTNSNNVYVAGFFYDPDSTMSGTNVMHWDGQKWKPENFWEGSMYAIYGFSTNNIWVGGSNGVNIIFGHWDGQKWNRTELTEGQVTGLWGSASDNLFATMGSGKILRYNGSVWSQMETGTNIFLSDIWGFSEKEIYASGYNESTGIGVLLFYDGVKWNKLYESGKVDSIPSGQTTTVWGYDTSHIYIRTSSGFYTGNRSQWDRLIVPNDNTWIEKIRGSSQKNIFFIGHFSLVIHWNGKNWHRYDELYRKPNGDILYAAWVFKDQVFIVGRSETTRGIVYRGTIGN